MVIPKVEIPEVVIPEVVVLQVKWRITRVLAMKMMMRMRVRIRMTKIHRQWSTNPRSPLSHVNWQASTGISGVHGKHLGALIIGGARLIIAVGGAVDWRSRVQKPTDQSRLILCCDSDVILETGSRVFLFLWRIIISEELWAWLITWEELGTVHPWVLLFLYGLDLWSWYRPGGVFSGLWVRSSRGITLELSGRATFTLYVYMSNRWIDKSIYASPIWQLHHKSMYASLCARIGPTIYCVMAAMSCSYLPFSLSQWTMWIACLDTMNRYKSKLAVWQLN